jgi:hypothetical protein
MPTRPGWYSDILLDPSRYRLDHTASLLGWAEHAKTAEEVRHAAIPEAYGQARYQNIQNFRQLLLQSASPLDQSTLKTALGKLQPKQSMWGVSGRAVLGVMFKTLPQAVRGPAYRRTWLCR